MFPRIGSWTGCLAFAALVHGCASDGSGDGIACKGKRTRCAIPAEQQLALPEDLTEIWLLGLPSLEPTWAAPVAGAPQSIFRPVLGNESLWLVPRYSEAPYLVRQLDMRGNVLSEYSMDPPGGVTRAGEESFQEFAVAAGNDGPIVSAAWSRACKGDETAPCQTLELLTFHASADQGPDRHLLSSPVPWVTSLEALQLPGSSDVLALHAGLELALQRIDTRGKLVWQQGALSQAFASSLLSAPTGFVKDGTLVLAGLSANQPGKLRTVALTQIDELGNVASHRLAGPFPDDLIGQLSLVESADGKVLLGSGDTNINVRVQRFTEQYEALDGVLLRGAASVTLAADELGNVIVRTVSVGLLGSHVVLCKLPSEGDVSCFSTPRLNSSIAVAGDGAVFGLDRDQQLLRYDLP
jgi:hypothetical protein